jgi:hypothetical protein
MTVENYRFPPVLWTGPLTGAELVPIDGGSVYATQITVSALLAGASAGQQWNAGTVSAVGSGLLASGGTLSATAAAPLWTAPAVSAIGANLSITSGTLAAAGSVALPEIYNLAASVPTLASMTTINTGSRATVTQGATSKFISLFQPSLLSGLAGVVTAEPATPYRVAALLGLTSVNGTAAQVCGIVGWTDGTKYWGSTFTTGVQTTGQIYEYSSDSSGPSGISGAPGTTVGFGNPGWIGARNDGTTLYLDTSMDGVNWTNFYSVLIASSYAPAKTGVFIGLSVSGGSFANNALTIFCLDKSGLTRALV